MKRSNTSFPTFLAVCALLLAAPVAGCTSGAGDQGPERALSAADAGGAAALAPDELLTITLDSRTSTGFAWRVDQIDESVLRLAGREQRSAPLLGGRDQEILHFAGVARGRTSLGLFYRRPSDPPGTGDPVYRVEVEVDGPYAGPYQAPAASAAGRVLAAPVTAAIPTRYNACESSAGAYARCTSIKNQGSCGGCWAFATAGVLENALYLSDPTLLHDLSEQYLISCNSEGWSCDGGYVAFPYYIDRKVSPPETDAGAVYEADFPYTAQNTACGSVAHPHHEKAASWTWAVTSGGTVEQRVAILKQALLDHGPLWTTVCADAALQTWTPSAGVFHGSGCTDVNHAVVLVGWDDGGGAGYWIVRNSWGARWGDQGYFRIAWGANAIASNAAYVVLQGTNQPPLASAGAAQAVDEGTAVSLNGSASSDADGSIQGYSWVQTSGAAVTLSGAGTARPTFTAPAVSSSTVLAFRLTVRDDRGAESSAGTTVTVQDVPPPTSLASGGVTAGCGTEGTGATAWGLLLGLLAVLRARTRTRT